MKKNIVFYTVIIVLVLTCLCSMNGIAAEKSTKASREKENYYYELEQEYLKAMRAYLNQEGYMNSGVMLTRTVYEDGSREYLIQIHNSKFDGLTEEEKETLIVALEEQAFAEENCSFEHLLKGKA